MRWTLPAGLAAVLCACVHSAQVRSEANLPTGIKIDGSVDFVAKARQALLRLEETRAGRKLLRRLGSTGKEVVIRYGHLDYSGGLAIPTGSGDSVVIWNPANELPDFPAFLGLHHELVHALHQAEGEVEPGPEQELRVIGVGKYASSSISENALRQELGLPLRTRHESIETWRKEHGKPGLEAQ